MTLTGVAHHLTLAQWFSPGFPVGAFSYSHGLEWAVESGEVTSADTLETWIAEVLQFGAGRTDAQFIVQAYRAEGDDELDAVDARCRAFAASKERLLETERQGAAFAEAVAAAWGGVAGHRSYPVAVGQAARAQDLPLAETLAFYLQAFASNLVMAGLRLAPIGQSDGQCMIRNLSQLCLEVAGEAAVTEPDDLSSTVFLADIASMKHETQYSRIFRT